MKNTRPSLATAVVDRAPGDRVVVGLGAAVLLLVALLVEREQDVDLASRLLGEVVPLVGANPGVREALGRGVRRVLDLDRRLLELVRARGVVIEQRPALEVVLPLP